MTISWNLGESWVVNNWQYSLPTFLFTMLLWKILSYKAPVVSCDTERQEITKTKKKLSEEEYVGGTY